RDLIVTGVQTCALPISKPGYDPSSIRYYLGPASLARYANTIAGRDLKFRDEVEIAQARYSVENQTGILSLVGFPTSQLAEEYFRSEERRVGKECNILV